MHDKWTLNRLVLDKNGIVLKDPKMNKPGRGAYVCDDTDCWRKPSMNERLRKALKAEKVQINAMVFDDIVKGKE